MNKKKIAIIITLAIVASVGAYIFTYNKDSKPENIIRPNKVEQNIKTEEEKDMINFLKSVSGLKAEKVELIDSPVALKGEFLAPKESILSGVDYFLKDTKNDKMDELSIDIGDGYVKARVVYTITKSMSTPIEVKVIPSLNKDKDLVLKIDEVKFLDLKISKWIVDLGVKSFIKDWFPKDQGLDIQFSDEGVLIYKENFEGVGLNDLSIDSKGLKLEMVLDLEKII